MNKKELEEGFRKFENDINVFGRKLNALASDFTALCSRHEPFIKKIIEDYHTSGETAK